MSVAPFFFAFSHFRPTSPTLLKNPWAFVRKQTTFRQKSTSFETKQTSKIHYWAFPLGYPPATPTFAVGCRCATALYLRHPTGYSPPARHNSAHVSHATRHAFQLPFLQSPFTSSLCPFGAQSEAILQKKAHLCITRCTILHKRWGVR